MDDYVVGEILGEGAFSIVYACAAKSGYGDYAVKMVDKIESPLEVIKMEVELLGGLKHPNIVNCVEVFYEKCFVCIVLDRYPGGDLFNGMQLHWEDRGRIPCRKVIHLKRQMFSAVTFLHNENVVHRDVKGDNYLLDRYDIVDPECHLTLTDFGSACRISDGERLSELVGTRTYWAPELFRKDYGKKADDWAVGIVVCGLLTGAFPFNGDEAIRNPDRPAKITGRLPPDCLAMVKALLHKDEDERMTSAQAAEHVWMLTAEEYEAEMEAMNSMAADSPTHRPTKSRVAARETPPDEDVRDRRMELFERLEIEAQRRSTLLGARASTAGKEERLISSRFLVPNRRERKQYGYEWWPLDKAVEEMGKEELGFAKKSTQILRRGDHVRITKESRCKGKTAVVIQPYWHGLVKVVMDEEDARGMTKSYKLADLVPIEPPEEEISRFKEGDRVTIIKDVRDSSMKGKSAIVTDPSSTGIVQVRVEEEDSMKGMHRSYRPDCLELDDSQTDSNNTTLIAGIDTLGTANVNVQVIGQMLRDHGIVTSEWGKGQAKPLKALAQEVQNGTSQLMLDATQHRTLVRVVNIVLLRICYKWDGETRFLVEASETSPEGWTRSKARLIGTKKEPHENTKVAARRAVENYLPDGKVSFNYDGNEVFEEEDDSTSFPGMRTVYRKEIVEGWVTSKNEDVLQRVGFRADAPETPTWGFTDHRGNTKVFEWLTERQCEKREIIVHVPDEWDEISCLVNPSATGLSEENLGEALKASGIDPKVLAQTPGAKKLEDLVDETKRGECTFVMEPDGRVLRMVDIVLLKLTKADPDNPGKSMILIQADEAPMDYPEEKKILARLPGNKLKPTENEFLIARSILSRKLGIDENCVSLNPDDVVTSEEAKTSNSYPGLLTYYRKRMITAQVIMPKAEGDSTSPLGISPQNSLAN